MYDRISISFAETKNFLIESLQANGVPVPENVLGKYKKPKPVSEKREFFQKLIHHSYNRQMGPNVIGLPLRRKEFEFLELVCDYDAKKVITKWGREGHKTLLKALQEADIAPSDAEVRKLWPLFSQSVIDAAIFVESIDDFVDFVAEVGRNEFAMLGAISLIQSNIRGYGQSLAADVLKESGLIDSVKPDTHIKKFAELISLPYRNDTDLLIKLNRDCLRSNLSPYEFDKFVWLVFSRGFYEHKGMKVNFSEAAYRNRIVSALSQLE